MAAAPDGVDTLEPLTIVRDRVGPVLVDGRDLPGIVRRTALVPRLDHVSHREHFRRHLLTVAVVGVAWPSRPLMHNNAPLLVL